MERKRRPLSFIITAFFGGTASEQLLMTVARETLRAAEHWWQHTVPDKRLGRTGKAVWKGSADPGDGYSPDVPGN